MIESRVDAHERKCFGQGRGRDLDESVPLIEAMRGHELVYRAEKQVADLCSGRGQDQLVEQPAGYTLLFAAVSKFDEHLPERALMIPDVTQRDSSHDLSIRKSNPKIAAALLIETRDIEQIRLVIDSDGNSKFISLN